MLWILWYRALILILEKVLKCRYDLIIGPILLPSQVLLFFSCWGTENSQMVLNQENMEGGQLVQSHSHAQQPLQQQTCVQEHCPGEIGLPSSIFQAVHEMSLVLLFKVLNYLISSVGLSGRKHFLKHLVSGKVEFSACQVSFLWWERLLSQPMNFSALSHAHYFIGNGTIQYKGNIQIHEKTYTWVAIFFLHLSVQHLL